LVVVGAHARPPISPPLPSPAASDQQVQVPGGFGEPAPPRPGLFGRKKGRGLGGFGEGGGFRGGGQPPLFGAPPPPGAPPGAQAFSPPPPGAHAFSFPDESGWLGAGAGLHSAPPLFGGGSSSSAAKEMTVSSTMGILGDGGGKAQETANPAHVAWRLRQGSVRCVA
jgi:hypothetical protein